MIKPNILISGKMRSGKDSIAKFIESYTNGEYKRIGLADPLKEEYSQFTGFPKETIEILKNYSAIRQQLILLGQARKWQGINKRPTHWLDKLPKNGVIIADIRYEEEVNYFADAIKIRIECPREIRALRGKLSNEDHPSECELDSYTNWNYMLDGSKPFEKVTEDVTKIINTLGDYSVIS